MAFDPNARLEASNAHSAEELIAQFGEVGLKNAPRTGAGRRSTLSCEAYGARHLFLHLATIGALKFPISIEHADKPDFSVCECASEYGLEVTEAGAPEDGAEMAKSETSDTPTLLGAFGGRGKDGYAGDEPLIEAFNDIQGAITRKASKSYVKNRTTDLLIYPNSNPVTVLAERDRSKIVRRTVFDLHAFRRVFIMWKREDIDLLPRWKSSTTLST